jgi:hypothetical protein
VGYGEFANVGVVHFSLSKKSIQQKKPKIKLFYINIWKISIAIMLCKV